MRPRLLAPASLLLLLTAVGTGAGAGCGSSRPPPAPTSARLEVPIVLFSTRWCPSCAETRAWLYGNNLIFDEVDVQQSRTGRAAQLRLNPAGTVPTLLIDRHVVVGHDPRRMRELIDRAAWERLAERRREREERAAAAQGRAHDDD